MLRRYRIAFSTLLILPIALAAPPPREREPNAAYAERRARLRAQLDGPVVLFGYTGKENDAPSYVFLQEENFYYLTGHNEPGAALVLVPEPANGRNHNASREILFLPPRDSLRERWDGPQLAPGDPGLAEALGFADVRPFADLRGELARLGRVYSNFYTLLPGSSDRGYPHARQWQAWLAQELPQASLRDARAPIGAMRQVKSPGELQRIERATQLSIEAHLEAMRMMRPGLREYEVAARMEYIHKRGGAEAEAYAPIVASGRDSTVLHSNRLEGTIDDGEVVVVDVGAQVSGYAADITRTLPANGLFSPRQREIYEIVLGAQNAVLAALQPGMTLGRNPAEKSLYRIAYDYINSHGADREGKRLGKYFLHGLGHHVGLRVHDAGNPDRPLEPGMVITIEPGIYLPEESLGVRIEDMVVMTPTGYTLLTARLPRAPAEIERFMAEAKRPKAGSPD